MIHSMGLQKLRSSLGAPSGGGNSGSGGGAAEWVDLRSYPGVDPRLERCVNGFLCWTWKPGHFEHATVILLLSIYVL